MKRFFRIKNTPCVVGSQFYLAGGAAGVANTIIACMSVIAGAEVTGRSCGVIRIRLQTQRRRRSCILAR
jgi:hypothetical protein